VNRIDSFKDEHAWLSNMHPVRLVVRDLQFECSEAVYAAAKCARAEDRARFVGLNGYQSKRLGRKVEIRADWNDVRVDVMRKVLRMKFAHGTELAERLLGTGDAELVEGNWWKDRFWGVCEGTGENWLGRLLMERRAELHNGKE
jgi:ribA/ribD-fused uncharacterized protein